MVRYSMFYKNFQLEKCPKALENSCFLKRYIYKLYKQCVMSSNDREFICVKQRIMLVGSIVVIQNVFICQIEKWTVFSYL